MPSTEASFFVGPFQAPVFYTDSSFQQMVVLYPLLFGCRVFGRSFGSFIC
jgi:hypothetical protein